MTRNYRTIFGILLILAGLLLFGQQMGLIEGDWDEAFLALGLGMGVFFFATLFFEDRTRWWAAMVSLILAASGITQLVEIFFPSVNGTFIGSGVLFMMGLAFLVVYVLDRRMWWALFPSGVMFSLTATSLIDELIPNPGFDTDGLLFFGLGLTFLALYLLPSGGHRMTWAIFPALFMLVFGLFVTFEDAELWNYIWPGLIILLGLYFIVNSLRRS